MGGQDLEVAGAPLPSLTTTYVDKPYMGRLAARHLVEMVESGKNSPVRIIVPTRVVPRDSVAKLAASAEEPKTKA
jgi:DNA-binding LacI/PurR family transcriptional regulator